MRSTHPAAMAATETGGSSPSSPGATVKLLNLMDTTIMMNPRRSSWPHVPVQAAALFSAAEDPWRAAGALSSEAHAILHLF